MLGNKDYDEKEASRKDFALANEKIKKQQASLNEHTTSMAVPIEKTLDKAPIKQVQKLAKPVEVSAVLPVAVEPKKQTKLEYYEENLKRLKDELYSLRESQNEDKMACLNDITAMNYWMIKVLENKNEACARADAIKQMKSYNKASAVSCGRSSIRYVEWKGRIKPYVGQKLSEAEAGCNK